MSFDRLQWKPVAASIIDQLPSETGIRETIGQILLDRLQTYGEFFDRLANERDQDILFAQSQQDSFIPPTPATFASLTIGSLTITSLFEGERGNDIEVEITSGSAENFEVTQIDPELSQAQLSATIDTLYGNPPPVSENPDIAALQIGAASFLASLDDATKSEAEGMIRDSWDRFRNARSGMDFDRNRSKYVEIIDNLRYPPTDDNPEGEPANLPEEMKQNIMSIYDTSVSNLNNAVTSVFNITVTLDSTIERYNDVVPATNFTYMYTGDKLTESAQLQVIELSDRLEGETDASIIEDLSIQISNIVNNPSNQVEGESEPVSSLIREEWNGNTRPPNGIYSLSGGINASPGRTGVKGLKPEGSYTLFLDQNRSFSLSELREIVERTMRESDAWLESA